jgi:hypothetical protein
LVTKAHLGDVQAIRLLLDLGGLLEQKIRITKTLEELIDESWGEDRPKGPEAKPQ